jgi:ankyrin repeat protein
MKKIVLFIMFIAVFNSCASELKGFEFSNFENTPISELAKAVRDNDVKLIREIVKSNQLDIDYKEPIYQQTLLTLAIVNRKQEACVELLKAKADPNVLLGSNEDSTPLTEAILHQENCDLFYIESLLKHGANPNLEIISKDEKHFFFNSYPLIVAIGQNDKNGEECLNIIKLLVEYGANINCCNPRPMDEGICEGVIDECLTISSMENLRYFVIEKKIKIPKIVYIRGGINKATQQEYSLTEILNTEDYQFEDFEDETGKVNRSKSRKIRNEILEYLKNTGQE